MRISIQTLGTRGDVQPFIALALGLLRRGHEVQLAAPAQLASLVESRGVRCAPLPGEFLDMLDTPEGKAAVAGGATFSAGLKLLGHVRPLMRRLLDEEWAAVRAFEPDLVLHHPKSLAAPHIAERLSLPRILASPLPGFTPTSAFPSPLVPFASLGPFNKASHALAARGGELLFGGVLREWRESSLGLRARPSVRVSPVATLYAYSPRVVPVPPDWGDDVVVTGYWFLDEEAWQPPDELAAFLAAGARPIYVGFGSMPGIDPKKLATDVVAALAKTGNRGVLSTGAGALALDDVPPHVHVVSGSVPHDRLFRSVSATILHGGAGTTAASLRAGVPTIVCPFFGDQPFWARRVEALGVGKALDRKRLSADALAAAIEAASTSQMRARAEELGAEIRREDGVAAAVACIERSVTHPRA